MKFAKLLRPLFFVALGIHVLALFLPIGDDSETAEVDATEETITKGAPLSSTPNRLPVLEPNATAAGDLPASASVPDSLFGSTFSAAPAALTQSAPASPSPGRPITSARSAPLAAVPTLASVTPAARPNAAAISPSVGSSPAPPVSAQGQAANSSTSSALPNVDSANSSSSASQTDNDSATKMPVTEGSTDIAVSPSSSAVGAAYAQPNQGLIASAITQLPDSLKALMNKWAIALAYSSKNTSDRSAKANASKWTAKINAQAGDVGVSNLEPLQVEDFAVVSYPIESSKRESEQSFRVCLEQPPSAAEVGVLFDSQGKIVGEPELIRSTGYAGVNNEIVATIKNAGDLPNDRLSKAFIFEVAVDYDADACISLSELKR